MRKIEPRAGQLVRWNPKKGGRYVQTAAFELAKEAEDRVGKIYGLMAVDAPQRAGEALFAHVEDALGRGVLEALRKYPADTPHEQVFEYAISCVNRALSHLTGEHGIGLEPEYATAALIAVRGSGMAAAVWGRPSVLLYRLTSTGNSRAFDIADGGDAAPAHRCFGSVISGPLGDKDRLLVASQDPRELIDEAELSAFMASTDPGEAAARISEHLAGFEDVPAIAALTVDVAPVRYLEDSRGRISTESSLDHFHGVQSRTAETLSPSALTSLQRTIVDTATAASDKFSSMGKKEQSSKSSTPAKPAGPGFIARALKALPVALWRMLKGLGGLLKLLFTGGWKTAPATVAAKVDGFAIRTIDGFNSLAPARRHILFAVLTAVFAFNASVLALSWKDRLGDFAAAGEQRVAAIGQKIDSAEASMIYRDESRARAILAEAEAEIATLPARSEEDRAAKDELTARIAESRDGMRRAVRLAAPETVASVSVESGVADLARLASVKGALWGASADGALFRITTEDGAATKVGAVEGGSPKALVSAGNNILAAAGVGSAALVPASGKGTLKTARIDTQGAAIADADVWNGRLYVLDPAHNRILRHSADAEGYGAPQFYLKDATDVSRGVSMAIDGEVWVLSSDGSVVRLLSGSKQQFSVASVEPAMTAAKRIRTSTESNYLHVLDAGRIVRFDKKSGALVAQYEHDDLAGATDFVVSDDGKSALVTAGNRVLRFALPQ